MAFKFEKLKVWQLALEYINLIYAIAEQLPPSEMYNLKSQIIRAATSVSLNIAEGSQGQTDAEQARFLGLAIRSAIETVACLHIIRRRAYIADPTSLRQAYQDAQILVRKLQAMRRAIAPAQQWVREDITSYLIDEDNGF